MRAELTTVERDDHLVRREELWERRDSGAGCATIKGPGMPKGFASETAAATGLSKATINRALSRGKSIPADIRDTIKGVWSPPEHPLQRRLRSGAPDHLRTGGWTLEAPYSRIMRSFGQFRMPRRHGSVSR